MCGLFGVDSINCGLMENYSVEYTAQKLRELCRRAGKYTIGVEPMPYSGLPDVKKAWAVVQAAGCDNAKLLLDSLALRRADQPLGPVGSGGHPGGEDRLHPDQRRAGPPLCHLSVSLFTFLVGIYPHAFRQGSCP